MRITGKSRYLGLFALLFALGLVLSDRGFCQENETAPRQVPFAAVFEVADEAYEAIAEQKSLPDTFRIGLGEGQSAEISAAQALGLLAEAADAASRQNPLASLPLLAPEIGYPVASADSSPPRTSALALPADSLLAEARPLLNFTTTLGALPSAVWVGGERLSAEEFLEALASVFQFFGESGHLPRKVRIVPCQAPSAWRIPTKIIAENSAAVPALEPAAAPAVASSPTPSLSLFPGNGAELSGEVDFVAVLEPAIENAAIFFFLDDQLRLITNWAPFHFPLDGNRLSPGEHWLLAQAQKPDGEILASHSIRFIVTAPAK